MRIVEVYNEIQEQEMNVVSVVTFDISHKPINRI